MTTLEMQIEFETLLQTTSKVFDEGEKPDTDTIFMYLNRAQIELIEGKYLSYPTFAERALAVSNATIELGDLIEDVACTVQVSPPYTNSKLYKPAKEVWHYIVVTGEGTRTYPYASNGTMELRHIEADEITDYIVSSVHKPIISIPVFTEVSGTGVNNLLVIYDAWTTYSDSNTKTHCLVFPKKLVLEVTDAGTQTIECQLAAYLHPKIVELAVKLFQEYKFKLISKDSK